MDSIKRRGEVSALEEIGTTYEEPRPSHRDVPSDAHFGTNYYSPCHVVVPTPEELSEAPTEGTELYSPTLPTAAVSVFQPQNTDSTGGFTFSGQPHDVVRFRSCILVSSRGDTEMGPQPRQSGPFSCDILFIIFLYIDVSSPLHIIAAGHTCRQWRFYANFAPHWTYFRRMAWASRQVNLPKYIRAVVAKPKIVTRQEYVMERQKVEECRRMDCLRNRAKHLRWCVAVAIMAAAMITANFVVAYFFGFLRTALRSDVKLCVTTFILMTVMTILEVTIVIIPLGGVSSPSQKDGMLRVLSWGLFILAVSVVVGMVTALAFTRAQATGRVLDGPTLDFTMDAECTSYPSNAVPSFALLPALLTDIRWRPVTMDPAEASLVPYCVKRRNDDSTLQCYNLLYFDAFYESEVFANASALALYKDVGSSTALGFDSTETGKPIPGTWCTASLTPQVIALTTSTYEYIRVRRDDLFPSVSDWLNPDRRPHEFSSVSYRCSSAINRERTESPSGSSVVWFEYSVPWLRHHIPLLSTERQVRSTLTRSYYHFLKYAFTCYIITAVLWGVQLLAQCVFQRAAMGVLGATTTVVLVLLNPITMIVSGALCVHVDDWVVMCSATSGGALIGGGVALLFLLTTLYVSLSG